jgi:uncharacterized protein (UPF0333 family)
MSHASLTLAAVLLFAQGYVIYKLTQMEKIMATVPAGLAAATQAETDLAAAVTAETAADNQIIAHSKPIRLQSHRSKPKWQDSAPKIRQSP